MHKSLLIIDGNSLFFRAYYGTLHTRGGILKNSQNIPVNALLTFTRMLLNLIKNFNPSHIFVAFDTGQKTTRHELFKDYKSKRVKAPDDLKIQFPLARELLDSFDIKYFSQKGFEADDIIATLATKYLHKFTNIYIVSSDRDLLQLVNPSTSLVIPQNNSKQNTIITHLNFLANYGIFPHQVVDFKGLVGDKSDNLPGVKGIGQKGAINLLKEYNSLENIYNNLEQISEKTRNSLIKDREIAFLSKKLASLHRDLDLPFSLENIAFNPNFEQKTKKFYQKYELFSLIKKPSKNSANDF